MTRSQRLGAGVADQHAARVAAARVSTLHDRVRDDAAARARSRFSRTGTLISTCGKRCITRASSESGLPVLDHEREDRERGDQAVAGGGVVEEDDVARLLAAEVVAAARISSTT